MRCIRSSAGNPPSVTTGASNMSIEAFAICVIAIAITYAAGYIAGQQDGGRR